jgi:hypothetical protein
MLSNYITMHGAKHEIRVYFPYHTFYTIDYILGHNPLLHVANLASRMYLQGAQFCGNPTK